MVIPQKKCGVSKVMESIDENVRRSLNKKLSFSKRYIGTEKSFRVMGILYLR